MTIGTLVRVLVIRLTTEGQQVFEGTLCGRQGAFVWHERAHKRGGSVSASCEILEGSGT